MNIPVLDPNPDSWHVQDQRLVHLPDMAVIKVSLHTASAAGSLGLRWLDGDLGTFRSIRQQPFVHRRNPAGARGSTLPLNKAACDMLLQQLENTSAQACMSATNAMLKSPCNKRGMLDYLMSPRCVRTCSVSWSGAHRPPLHTTFPCMANDTDHAENGCSTAGKLSLVSRHCSAILPAGNCSTYL